MQISTQDLSKLIPFLLANLSFVVAGLIPHSPHLPDCSDLTWDENDTGFQSRICTISHPNGYQADTQSSFSKRSSANADLDQLASIISAQASHTPEADNSCTSTSNTASTSKKDHRRTQPPHEIPDAMDSNSTIQRRNLCAASDLPYRSSLIDNEEAHSKSWCFRPGPSPDNNQVTSLCDNIAQLSHAGSRQSPTNPFHDDFVVQRARGAASGNVTSENGGLCTCVSGRERTAGFKVCNCDRCDSLVINHGLANMCRALQEQCTRKGFSSGYIKSALNSEYSNSIISLFSYPDGKGRRGQPMELDPILSHKGVVMGSCRSGDDNMINNDYSGPVMDCNAFFIGRFAGGRWCKDMVAGGERKWVKDNEDPFVKLRGKPKEGGFSQWGNK